MGGYQNDEYHKEDFGDEISVMNSYADNAGYGENRDDRYA